MRLNITNNKALDRKREGLIAAAYEAIPTDLDSRRDLAQVVVSALCELEAPAIIIHGPQIDLPVVGLITTKGPGGIFGAISRKTGNLTLSWPALLGNTVVAAAAATGPSWLLPFIFLVICSNIAAGATVQVSPDHAMAIHAMWENRSGHGTISHDEALKVTNSHRTELGYPELNEAAFVGIIDELLEISCVELAGGDITLIERVKSTY